MDGIVAAVIGVIAASVLGRTILAGARVRLLTREGEWGAAFSAGYVVLGSAYALAGFAGAFDAVSLNLLTWVALLIGITGRLFTPIRPHRPRSLVRELLRHSPPLAAGTGMVLAVVGVGVLVRALAPSTEGDALCYHLELPRQFLKLGRIAFLPWTDHSLLPFLADLWYALPLSTGSVLGPRLISVAVGAAFACAVLELAMVVGGLRCAAWAVLLVVTAPVFANHASVCFSDLPVALLAAWGMVMITRLCVPRTGKWGDAAIFGLYAAGAAACKLTGLIWCFCAVGVVIAVVSGQRIRVSRFWPAAVGLALVALPWYVRAWYHTGNPVFPFMAQRWPGSAVVYDWRPPKQAPVSRSVVPLLSLPWKATVSPEQFGGRGHQWGIAFLALLPGLWIVRHKSLAPILFIAGLYAVVWALTRQNLRFLLPVMSPLAVGGGVLIEAARGNAPGLARLALWFVLLLHVTAGLAAAGRKAVRVAQRAAFADPDGYLATCEPTYALGKRLQGSLPPGSIVLTPEHRLFYLPGIVLREDALRRWLGTGSKAGGFCSSAGTSASRTFCWCIPSTPTSQSTTRPWQTELLPRAAS